jgi:uncharacterized membrane protein YsdA (DUF1294 family)
MYDYDQVKYRTPLQWGTLLVISFVFGVFGSVAAWAVVTQYTSKHTLNIALMATAAAFLAAAVIELPAAAIFFCRRWRGEIIGYFDCEVVMDPDKDSADGVNHGSDHR